MFPLLATILGIGFLLFIHEGGHFLAARMAGVRVETFSLGFGPRVWGWSRKGTDFRLSLIPVGGYVKLAGDEMTRPPLPDELGAASPGWRFLIFSGGILMNFLFALIMIPILFGVGVPTVAPVVGGVEAGGPAWQAGIQGGDRVLEINGRAIHSYRQFASEIALSDADELSFLVEGPEGGQRAVVVEPEFDSALGIRRIRVTSSMAPDATIVVPEGSPAAELGLRTDQQLLGVNGVRGNGPLELRMLLDHAVLQGGSIELLVRDEEAGEKTVLLTPAPPPENAPRQIGVRELRNRVAGVKPGPLSEVFQEGDLLLEAGGVTVANITDLAQPLLRDGALPPVRLQRGEQELTVEAPAGLTVARLLATLWLDTGPELRLAVRPDGPAALAGLKTGDRLLRIDGQPAASFEELSDAVRAAGDRDIEFVVARTGVADPLRVSAAPQALATTHYGFGTRPYQSLMKSGNFFQALRMGIGEAHEMVREVLRTLQAMFSGRVGAENLGGIITIGQITHSVASTGLVPLLFFLSMISIHLGVLNLLPIPALDGGHLLFVIIEKLRGRPVSERTQGWFNLVGVVAILGLIFFVTYQDIRRLME